MCGCPAHSDLVDCNGCECDHGPDRISQWKSRALFLEEELREMTEEMEMLRAELRGGEPE